MSGEGWRERCLIREAITDIDAQQDRALLEVAKNQGTTEAHFWEGKVEAYAFIIDALRKMLGE